MKRFDARREVFSPYGFTCEQWTPARMSRPDRHNEIELNLFLSGSLTYQFGGRRSTIPSGALALFWGALPHQIIDFDDDAPYYVATVPLSQFLQIRLDPALVNRVLQGSLLLDCSDESDRLAFERWERDLARNDRCLSRAVQLEVEARLLRFSRDTLDHPADRPSEAMLTHADRLACYIARNYQQPLRIETIAEAQGIHPNYAMNLFRKTFGITMTGFIIQHRVSHAQRLLVTGNQTILDIALDAGFQSLSRFNEAFKMVCGCSPREYRKAHAS